MWKSYQHNLTPKYDILCSFVTLVKHYHVNYVNEDDKPFTITCQICNGYVRLLWKKWISILNYIYPCCYVQDWTLPRRSLYRIFLLSVTSQDKNEPHIPEAFEIREWWLQVTQVSRSLIEQLLVSENIYPIG